MGRTSGCSRSCSGALRVRPSRCGSTRRVIWTKCTSARTPLRQNWRSRASSPPQRASPARAWPAASSPQRWALAPLRGDRRPRGARLASTRQLHHERGALSIALHVDPTAVRQYDLLHDIQPEAEALAASQVPLRATERIEQLRQDLWRNLSFVGHREADELRVQPLQRHPDRLSRLAVLERVTDQIGSHLGEPVCIPEARQLPFLSNIEAPFRERAGMLLQNPLQDLPEIALLGA